MQSDKYKKCRAREKLRMEWGKFDRQLVHEELRRPLAPNALHLRPPKVPASEASRGMRLRRQGDDAREGP